MQNCEKMKNKKVFIDPRSNYLYSSFYILGLKKIFGKRNIHFSTNYFTSVDMSNYKHSNDRILLFVIKSNNDKKKIAIDFRDEANLIDNAYEWSDLYAKINVNVNGYNELPDMGEKVFCIAPSFGIRIDSIMNLFFRMLCNLFLCFVNGWKIGVNIKQYCMSYLRTIRRANINKYMYKKNTGNYLFFVSSLWADKNCLKTVNPTRASYVRLSKKNKFIDFEGGLVDKTNNSKFNEYDDVKLKDRYTIEEYILKSIKSIFVFNTPAVSNCHGWKLGEYLMMGQTIISTPIKNKLP